jgi:hypothetical protein
MKYFTKSIPACLTIFFAIAATSSSATDDGGGWVGGGKGSQLHQQ